MNSRTMRTSSIFFLATLGLIWSAPALGYRMLQVTQTGRVTFGNLVQCDIAGGFAHWAVGNHHITWLHNTANQGSGKAGALQSALASWNAVTGDDYNLSYGGTTTAGFVTDNINAVVWANGNGCTGNCLALTALVTQSGQVLVETDITFNNSRTWTTNGADFDTQAVAAHEFGHTLGIHHTEVTSTPRPTMYAFYFGADERTLEADDRAALRCSVNRYGGGTGKVRYQAYVQEIAWLSQVQDSETAGTVGQHKRMEAARIKLINQPGGRGVCYRSHVESIGWQGNVCNDAITGTVGQHKRMEAIQIWLTGAPSGCNIEYRAYVQSLGWLPWVQNGATAGTVGQHLRMEALQVKQTGSCG